MVGLNLLGSTRENSLGHTGTLPEVHDAYTIRVMTNYSVMPAGTCLLLSCCYAACVSDLVACLCLRLSERRIELRTFAVLYITTVQSPFLLCPMMGSIHWSVASG